jgi:hypothetical protein
MVPAAFATGLMLLAAACTHTYEEKKTTTSEPPVLTSVTRVYVGRPFDITYKDKVVHNSGKSIAEALLISFNRNTKGAAMSRRPQSVPEALESAVQFRAEFMAYPVILKWEDRSTEFSGIRDKLAFRLDLYEVGTGQVIHSKEFEAKSRWMTDGGDTPVDLLEQPIDLWVQTLFRRMERPSSLF